MIQIRKGTFETNSSSTHSICISKAPVTAYPKRIIFTPGQFGWETDQVTDTASYLFTAILEICYGDEDMKKSYMDNITRILESHGVEAVFVEPKSRNSWDNYYIDHSDELNGFVKMLLKNDGDMLLRFLFSYDSCVYTGNDNSDDDTAMCWCAESTYYDYDAKEEKPHPGHDEEHFDYFFKGN